MKTQNVLVVCLLVIFELSIPVLLQSLQSRHYRPLPSKCDRHGRCTPKEGYIEEADHEGDFKTDKERPPELTRDDWPVRPQGGGYEDKRDDKDDKPGGGRPGGGGGGGGYGGGYNPKPVGDRDNVDKNRGRPVSGGGYNPKPVEEDSAIDDYLPKDEDDIKPSGGGRPGGYGGGYNPKPKPDRDEDIKPVVRPGGGGGYGGGRPSGGGDGGGYNPKPKPDRDEDIKPVVRPGGGGGYGGGRPSGGGGGGGYNPKPVVERDDYDSKPGGGAGGGYNPKPGGNRGGYDPKPDEDDYNIKPARGGDGYPSDKAVNPFDEDLGGYNKEKDDDYNDDYVAGEKDNDYDEDDKPVPVVDANCICVPYYQCQDGHIVTDGAGIIDARKRPEPDEELPLDGKFKPPSCGPYHVCCNTPESSTVRPYEHRCGVRNPSGINSRILSPSNKGEADFGEWPWQAAVLKSEGKVNIFQCGGVLIDKYHVLTVAHCVFHLYQLNEYPLKVRLGEWDTQTTTEFLAHEDYKVSKIIIHPEYRNTSLWNDVAVLRLQDPVLFAPHIDTVCLPQYDEVFGGQNCVVTGWGKDAYKGGTFSNVMKEVALQVIDNYKCEEMLRKTRLGRFFQLHEGFLCAGGEYGIDSCKGDGGGPLVCYRKDKSYALAGIVSWGIDCGQPEVPGVYVKIQKYLDFISKTTGVTLQDYWPKQ